MTRWRKRTILEMAHDMNAIEQLKSVLCDPTGKCCIKGSQEDRAIVDRALKALAQSEQEPVCDKDPQGCWNVRCQLGKKCKNTPPASQRTWVELTEEDLKLLSAEWRIVYGAWMDDFAKDIEAKLKEKNT